MFSTSRRFKIYNDETFNHITVEDLDVDQATIRRLRTERIEVVYPNGSSGIVINASGIYFGSSGIIIGSSAIIFPDGTVLDSVIGFGMGLQGATGQQGHSGVAAATAFQGSTGIQGSTGMPGEDTIGAQGATGYQGATGMQGATGIGPQGATGPSASGTSQSLLFWNTGAVTNETSNIFLGGTVPTFSFAGTLVLGHDVSQYIQTPQSNNLSPYPVTNPLLLHKFSTSGALHEGRVSMTITGGSGTGGFDEVGSASLRFALYRSMDLVTFTQIVAVAVIPIATSGMGIIDPGKYDAYFNISPTVIAAGEHIMANAHWTTDSGPIIATVHNLRLTASVSYSLNTT